ncbi:hypothetical protein ABEB36_014898 [Hypothenemus hampei]|uniref:Uncharacterized protein n=1 Tax=Hypothenemus hampei TaxID=57062 RepID=A0ABD1E255_HYPHA
MAHYNIHLPVNYLLSDCEQDISESLLTFLNVALLKRERKEKKNTTLCHAFTGCDKTCAIFEKGKKKLNVLKKKENLRSDVEPFNNPNSTKERIKEAGERLILSVLIAKPNPSMYFVLIVFLFSTARLFHEVRLAQLSSTAETAEQHAYGVYLQV